MDINWGFERAALNLTKALTWPFTILINYAHTLFLTNVRSPRFFPSPRSPCLQPVPRSIRARNQKHAGNVNKRGAEELKYVSPEDREEEQGPKVSKAVIFFLLFVVGGSVVVPIFMKIGSGPVF